MTKTYKHIQIDPATPTIGAYVSGIDLNHVGSDDVYDEIKQAHWQHGVLFFRKQALNPESFIRLGKVFGDMEKHEFFPHIKDYPQIQLVAHEGTETPETDRWHADVTFRKKPSMVSMLRITDLPPNGGDTMWMSAAAAFEALGPQMQQMLLGLKAEHDMPWQFRSSNVYDKLARKQLLAKRKAGLAPEAMPSPEEMRQMRTSAEHKMIDDNPSVTHPAVITHPYNGRKILYVNSVWTKCFEDLHMDISDALLQSPWARIRRWRGVRWFPP